MLKIVAVCLENPIVVVPFSATVMIEGAALAAAAAAANAAAAAAAATT